MLSSLRAAGADVSPAAPFHAPLFEYLVAGLGTDRRHVVLDLGAASTPMLSLLGQSRCRVEIVDLAHFGGVDRLNAAEPGTDLAAAADAVLPNRQSTDAVEVIFCWDLPNYLSLAALSALMHAIGQRAAPGAIAHALIAYADREMRERPGRFVPTPEGLLVDRNGVGNSIVAPRYSPEALSSHMGGFVIDRARLLGNGMQEFLFRSG